MFFQELSKTFVSFFIESFTLCFSWLSCVETPPDLAPLTRPIASGLNNIEYGNRE